MIVNNFGETLKRIMLVQNVESKEIAYLLNMSSSNICNYITGRVYPNLKSLIMIANYLNVSLDYLVTGEVSETGSTDRQIKLPFGDGKKRADVKELASKAAKALTELSEAL